MTTQPFTLDKWDIAFIRMFKASRPLDLNTVVNLWADRVAMRIDRVGMPGHVAEYLANLIDRLNLTPDLFKVIVDMAPHRGWQYGIPEGSHYTDRAIYVMAAWLRHTEVVKLPGYREAVEADPQLVVDGTMFKDGDGTRGADGQFAPFYVFDPKTQSDVAGPFDTRAEAERAAFNLDIDKIRDANILAEREDNGA